jgi:hypothetical protein
MSKFRKKPVVIEAWQWFSKGHAPTDPSITETSVHCFIETLEGTMTVSPGDWIIKGVKGEFYPCKPDIFEATYEAVND